MNKGKKSIRFKRLHLQINAIIIYNRTNTCSFDLKWYKQQQNLIRNYWWKHAYLTCVLLFGMFFGGFSSASLFKMPLTGVSTFDRFIWFSMFSLLFCFFLRWRTRLRFVPFVPLVSLVPTDSVYSLLAPTVKFGFCDKLISNKNERWFKIFQVLTLLFMCILTGCSINVAIVSDIADTTDSLSSLFGKTLNG